MTLGHGNMVEPPARATMHDYGFPDNPRDSNWMEGFCGGKAHQWSEKIGGKCGICGDPWDAAVREHEAPDGKYANGEIVRFYKPGDIITITSHITANHVVNIDICLIFSKYILYRMNFHTLCHIFLAKILGQLSMTIIKHFVYNKYFRAL